MVCERHDTVATAFYTGLIIPIKVIANAFVKVSLSAANTYISLKHYYLIVISELINLHSP